MRVCLCNGIDEKMWKTAIKECCACGTPRSPSRVALHRLEKKLDCGRCGRGLVRLAGEVLKTLDIPS